MEKEIYEVTIVKVYQKKIRTFANSKYEAFANTKKLIEDENCIITDKDIQHFGFYHGNVITQITEV